MLIDSADVVRSIGIELDATSSTFRTSVSDAVPVTALGRASQWQNVPGKAACVQCATRETRPCAWMVSCMPCADVTGAPAASESAVPPNSNLSKLFCVGVPTAASGDFACSVDRIIAWESIRRS